ncbi:hypothetical protein A2962_01490 [Candidatus Woesebacteria bacterium RIFCSPLOWO2_01_FULL_39_61]|uniref:DUF5673 domain-containing protein n=1 Tax=Candidatus Woesebacteria bacterium RIFCSPHIGHO2_02_FULL_39_13 TaxID=1802505 RepID=A0A1F7Z5W4_9BACT|nr:MAG: hypothetical protein A2692_01730 [Candidatus Woesebacteria bacterium RIFCSPHIGHO2_01_FULL_39_95]OGM34519.1 MAG: hypothetical protein A3D01_03180 [Candidatus Woesebacteria bacterium RIFCSPHIGHO2_02_FULL_39_13]OGM38787.1 MAG: hypothetical protein A3E13_01075 [Candidatus Woesebacteria bacterium RIFCSPHIGHO2_12_FULL_40_20]OGM65793.1 MAG: hypothetical protein A2962_01490 [Candidatus Woesebacteria bacterium RIFCSPLOWO2_01_FULL_39_61]OGM73866.1 MAG: hypothetical protein A3H19_04335 [Candidatus
MAAQTQKTASTKNPQEDYAATPPPQPIQPEKELFAWHAPARPFKRRGKEFWMTIIAIASLFSFILFLAEGAMPVILIVSVIFLFYVLSNVEPEEIQYKITTRGIRVVGRLTDMMLISRFWFSKRFDKDLLILEILQIPGRLELVINGKDLEKIRKVLSIYLPEEEIPPTNFDKLSGWLSEKLPGN